MKSEKQRLMPFEDKMERLFISKTGKAFHNLRDRLAEKLDKNKRVIRRGRELPFDLNQLRGHIRPWFNEHWEAPCVYCGRMLTLETFRLEHAVPLARGGPLTLANIVPADSDCNGLKGKLLPNEFHALMEGLKTFPEPARQDILGRLRGQMRFMRPKNKQTEVQAIGRSTGV